MPLSFANLPDARSGTSDLDFGGLPDAQKPSFGDVQAGVSSSPSFANVQGGANTTTNTSPLGYYAQKFTDEAGNLINNAPTMGGLMEAGANLESQGYAIPAGGVARLAVDTADTLIPQALRPIPLPTADEAQQAVTQALTYSPESESGQHLAEVAAYPFEKLAEGGQYLGQATLDATGSPALAAAVDTAVQVVPLAIAGRVGEHFTGRAPEAARAATEAQGRAQAAGKAPWDATEDALRAIQESDSGPNIRNSEIPNISPDEIRPQTPEEAISGFEANPSVKKTESKISDLQSANDADVEAAQRAAWGGDFSHLPDAADKVASLKDRADKLPNSFDELMKDTETLPDAQPSKFLGQEAQDGHPLFDDLIPKKEETPLTPETAREPANPENLDLWEDTVKEMGGKPPKEVRSKGSVLGELQRDFGSDFGAVEGAINNGKLRIISADQLPDAVKKMGLKTTPNGWMAKDGSVTIVADNLAPGYVRPLIFHEIGTHAGLQQMPQFPRYVAEVKRLVGEQHPDALRAVERVKGQLAQRNMTPEVQDRELVAYFVQHTAERIQQGKGILDSARSAYGKIKADVKNYLNDKFGMNIRITDKDMHYLALGEIKKFGRSADLRTPKAQTTPAFDTKEEKPQRVSREDIDKQAQAALAKGADAEAVKNRQMQLYREHGHEPAPTSTKNAVRDAERAAENRDPIIKEASQSNQTTLDAAKATLEKNPNRPNEIMKRLTDEGVHAISAEDEAVLLIHKAALRNMRDDASKIINDPNATDAAKFDARTTWGEMEAKINLMDQATEASGREWGRFGQFRQRMLRSDFSLDAMERRRRTVLGGRELTPEEHQAVKADFKEIEEAQKGYDRTQAAIQSAHEDSGVKYTYENLVKEMAGQLKTAKKKGTFLETLKKNADESRDWFKKNLSRASAGVDPTAFFHLARIGAYHIANGAVKFKDWVVKMKSELGEHFAKLEDSMPAVFKAAKEQHAFGATETKPRLRAKKDLDPNNITHKDVYDLARAHILNGVHGEDAVMKAVHGDLKEHGLSERDVRRLFSEYGETKFPSKEADKTELREIRSLVQMQESIDRINEGLPALKSGVQRDKATQLVREKRRQLNDLLKAQEAKNGMSPEKLVTYQEMRARNLRNQIEDLQKELATGEKKVRKPTPADSQEVQLLKVERDRLKGELKKIEEAKNPPPSPEEKYQATRSKQLQRELKKVYDRIQNNDYLPRKREIKELDAANQRAAYKLHQAKNLFNRHQYELQMEQRPTWKKIVGSFADTANLARAVMTSWDLSATLRQGGFVSLGHPVRATKALIASIKSARGEEYAYRIQKEIESRPNFYKYKAAGLDLTLGSGHELQKQEEQFMSRWLEKNAPVEGQSVRNVGRKVKNVLLAPTRASERAFRSFLNKLRADSFDDMVEKLSLDGKAPSTEEMKAIANYVNVATGRGKVGKTNQAAVGLNTVFFAPRLVASRFNLLAGQPMYGGTVRTRTMVAGEYARFLGGLATVYALGAAFHAAFGDKKEKFLEMDPRSSNFGKMKFGNTWIDPMAGLGQVSTFVGREVMGENKTQRGEIEPLRKDFKPANLFRDKPDLRAPGFGKPNSADIVFNFARTKLAPVPGAALNLATGKNVIGQPVTPGSEAQNMLVPMSLQNIQSIMQEHGIPAGTAITLLDMLGMSVQQRTPYKKQPEKTNGH